MRFITAGTHEVIRIDAAWIAVEPLDMRAGVDTALARVVKVFGEARSHHAYLFLNRRSNRLKVFVHDGFGLWLCARRLQQGHFMRPSLHLGERFELSMRQLQALAVGTTGRVREAQYFVGFHAHAALLSRLCLWQDLLPCSCRATWHR